jgi:hypothetical protein
VKIECEVLGVESRGDLLRVRLQGKAVGAADWQPLGVLELDVPPSHTNQKAFYVGRHVTVNVAPK